MKVQKVKQTEMFFYLMSSLDLHGDDGVVSAAVGQSPHGV
jgi:hypothetical protein